MKLEIDMLGGSASIGYVYPSTNTTCFSTNSTAWTTRICPIHGQEVLAVWSAGDWNKWEAVCKVNNICYAIKVNQGTPIEILRHWLGSNTIDGNYQAWIYWDNNSAEWKPCLSPGLYPVPKP
jgi:hypothetical protein